MESYYPKFFGEYFRKPSLALFEEEVKELPAIIAFSRTVYRDGGKLYLLSYDSERLETKYATPGNSRLLIEERTEVVDKDPIKHRSCMTLCGSRKFCLFWSQKAETWIKQRFERFLWVPPVLRPEFYHPDVEWRLGPAAFLVYEAPKFYVYAGGTPNSSGERTTLSYIGELLYNEGLEKELTGAYLLFLDRKNNLWHYATSKPQVIDLLELNLNRGKESQVQLVSLREYAEYIIKKGKKVAMDLSLLEKFGNFERN